MANKWNYKAINGKATMSEYVKASLLQDQKENENAVYQIKRLSAESKAQRGFYEGGVIPLNVYLDGNDYKNWQMIKHYREQLKKEFNGDMIIRNGKEELIGLSTKGKLNEQIETVINYLEENYGIEREKVLDPEHYKNWRDTIFSVGEHEHYIDYLISIGRLNGKM